MVRKHLHESNYEKSTCGWEEGTCDPALVDKLAAIHDSISKESHFGVPFHLANEINVSTIKTAKPCMRVHRGQWYIHGLPVTHCMAIENDGDSSTPSDARLQLHQHVMIVAFQEHMLQALIVEVPYGHTIRMVEPQRTSIYLFCLVQNPIHQGSG